MTFKGIEVVPGVLDFDQRATVLVNNQDILVTKSKVDESYLEYLTTLGYDFSKTTFINSSKRENTYNSIFRETKIIDFLRELDIELIDTYHLTRYENRFAKKINKSLAGNTNIAERYGTKSGFRTLCRKLGLPIVEGYEGIKTAEEVIAKIKQLENRSILLRLDEGISGAGNRVLNRKKFLTEPRKRQLNYLNEILNSIPQSMKSSGVTVEQWIDDVIASPSIQFEVFTNGEISIYSTHDQILDGKEKWYTGCSYPSSSFGGFIDNAIKDGFVFTRNLQMEGFHGHCGIDFIITNEEYYMVEANIRKQGTLYPREFVRKVYGGIGNINYTAQDIKKDSLIGKDTEYVLGRINNQLIKNSRQKEGILVYNTGALKEGGRFDIVVIGKTPEIRNQLIKEMHKSLD